MPAIRPSSSVKPAKYERTHEENQERAYIAASRRSDRCLEARMESARRASIVHKRRTGKALRITESDVINEEMYEEINDLPTEYRRLNAHLQTQSPEFDRRLLAYLSSQMAVRQEVLDCAQSDFDARFTRSNVSRAPPQPMPPSQTIDEIQASRPQDPYLLVSQSMRPRQYPRSALTSVPHVFTSNQGNIKSLPIDPPEGIWLDNMEHMFLPTNAMPLAPCYRSKVSAKSSDSPSRQILRMDSAVDITDEYNYLQEPISHHVSQLKVLGQPLHVESQAASGPLSTALPLHSQQLLAGNSHCPTFARDYHFANSPPGIFTDFGYSYNPNARPLLTSSSQIDPPVATPKNSSQFSPSPSRLWLDTTPGPGLSFTYDSAFSEVG